MLTKYQAKAILDAHDILSTLSDDEEMALLADNNPTLANAYYELHCIAYGTKGAGDPVNADIAV